LEVTLNPKQLDFVYSQKKYPAFVGAWGTGKTLCGISRSVIYSELIPGNQGMILRKQYTDLRDSTMKDFVKYTGCEINSQREVTFGNKSNIIFRCLDEFKTQNINLGWFFVEQAEELESDLEFMTLLGRLRRAVVPSQQFTDLGLPLRSGWIIANAGDNYIKKLWKDEPLEDFHLVESITMDNAANLPPDFIKSMDILKIKKPEAYRRYVENDWTVTTDKFVLIPNRLLDDSKQTVFQHPAISKHIVSCDPAIGGDECVVYYIKDNRILDEMILHVKDTMKIVGELMMFGRKHNCDTYAVDTIGIGKGIGDRLHELHTKVTYINSAEKPSNDKLYNNRRTEMYGWVMEQFNDRKLPYPAKYKEVFKEGEYRYAETEKDDELIKQLTSLRYKVIDSSGKIQLEPKQELKKRIGCSPDRADTLVYGLWALKDIKAKSQHKVETFRMKNTRKDVKGMYSGGKGGW
jgi:phage terminase large subunit